jgi:hypothetical protein
MGGCAAAGWCRARRAHRDRMVALCGVVAWWWIPLGQWGDWCAVWMVSARVGTGQWWMARTSCTYRQGDAVDCSQQAMGGAAAAPIWTTTLGM